MVTITAVYDGDLSCTATHGPSGTALRTDAPVDNEGLGRSFSPTDLAATSYATCMMTIMGKIARQQGIPLEGMRVTVEKQMSADPRRISALPVHISIPGNPTPEQRADLEEVATTCPVCFSLHPDIQTPVTITYPDATT